MSAQNLRKYLAQYAEPEIGHLSTFPDAPVFDHVLVIPACRESADYLERFFASTLAQQQVLLITVINQPDSCTDSTPQQQLFDQAGHKGRLCWRSGPLSLLMLPGGRCHLLRVDRFSQPIPDKQGVGLARKIGVDVALALKNLGRIRSRWIHSSDADAHLPNDYFTALSNCDASVKAACFNFDHYSADPLLHWANQVYQRALRYYVAGLAYAGSAYAFFTIGSILAFDAEAYAAVRGFPKRSAGEDFYLLNKLAKLGEVAFIADSSIVLDARPSDRVPFGTGPAVAQIIQQQQQQQAYCYYHPQVFVCLKHALAAFACLYQHRNDPEPWLADLPGVIAGALQALGIGKFVQHHRQVSHKQFDKQLPVWFDAFKTLKFIHYIRDRGYPDMPLDEAIAASPFDGAASMPIF